MSSKYFKLHFVFLLISEPTLHIVGEIPLTFCFSLGYSSDVKLAQWQSPGTNPEMRSFKGIIGWGIYNKCRQSR
jgi:hypothetical protein